MLNLSLADPDFLIPGRIDLLLDADIYADELLHGRRCRAPGTPTAFETQFRWVLTGRINTHSVILLSVASHHSTVTSGNEILRMFWEIEENPKDFSNLFTEELLVVCHFKETFSHSETGRFIIPLPKNPQNKSLSESRSQAVRWFICLSLLNIHFAIPRILNNHGRVFPIVSCRTSATDDLQKSPKGTFYLPMHAVQKEHSMTTKVRVVFDASAKSASVHPPLVDVLLRFRLHRVALTVDISKMYRAVELIPDDCDLHRFVWRRSLLRG